MKTFNELYLEIGGKNKTIYFGMPDNEDELNEMFRLRYDVYNSKNYLNKNIELNNLDKDDYDLENKCVYFIGKIDNKIIGTVRLIKDEFLPTEKECFKFEEPLQVRKILRKNRAELSRLIVVPYNKNKKIYFPRNLILLFLINCLNDFCVKNSIQGGYSFVTKKLYDKLIKLKIPIHIIDPHKLIYPNTGLLHPYFHQNDNPIIPIYYLRDEIGGYLDNIFNKNRLFRKEADGKYALKSNIYNKFLRILKII